MAGRRTNLALLVLLAWALATGALAFAIGAGWNRWITVAHGAGGLGTLLLVPWKSVVVRRGLSRNRPGRSASVALALAVGVTLVSGVGHATGLLRSVAGLTSIQLHVGSALIVIPLGVWHVMVRRIRVRRSDASRRALLRAGLLTAGSLATFGLLEGITAAVDLPGHRRRFSGSYLVGSGTPSEMPVTQWLNDRVPAVDPSEWTLSLSTDRGTAAQVTLEELERMSEDVTALLDCTGGWYAEQIWRGVRLDGLLAMAGRMDDSEARSVRVVSVTGYDRRFPLADAPRLWLATHVGGEVLSAGHGFPARIVAPGRRGFWWVKWVERVHVDATPWWWQPPYPLS